RRQKGNSRELCGVGRHSCAVLSIVGGPGYYSLLIWPDDAPDVKHHHQSQRSANTDRERFVAAIPCELRLQPPDNHKRHNEHENGNDCRKHPSVIYLLNDRHLYGKKDDWYQQPDKKHYPDVLTSVIGVCLQNIHRVVHQPHEYRNHRAPSKPPQRSRHQLRYYFTFCRTVERLHQVDVDQIEEIKMTYPNNPRQEM